MTIRIAILALALAAAPALAGPSPQLALQVSNRLSTYGIHVAPEALTTKQAAALHTYMSSHGRFLDVRRYAKAILSDPDYRE